MKLAATLEKTYYLMEVEYYNLRNIVFYFGDLKIQSCQMNYFGYCHCSLEMW